ncbi:MAG: PD-(D/E)XK nuclease domain-containing protein, partial [Deltaproteobacteria bacterium]|nr:PD-(D/E)XK nuclease domain-containing protein [Deltaproteobacteria bacterium]
DGILPPETDGEGFRARILERYDGYSWDGRSRVLNPWSVFGVFQENAFRNFWLDTGTPRFLSELAGKDWRIRSIFMTGSYLTSSMNSIDIGKMDPVALLFQSGYLTVKRREPDSGDWRYHLRFPNLEVEAAVYQLALGLEAPIKNMPVLRQKAEALLASLAGLDASGFQAAFETVLAGLPFKAHPANEGHYQDILLMALGAAGQGYESESRSGDGVLDVHLRTAEGNDYIIELKHVKGQDPGTGKELSQTQLEDRMEKAAAEALKQIEDKKYALKFQGGGNMIYKLALVIGRRSDVLAVFEKAGNWRLVREPDGGMRVAPE